MKIHRKDYKFVPKNADADFDPKRNEQIINEVIEESRKLWEAKKKAFSNKLEERTDAVATYLRSLEQGGANSRLDKYFGRKHLAYLRGQEILQKIQKDLTIVKNGKIIKRAGD